MSELLDTLKFPGGITRQQRSGVERITFRMGHRRYVKNIKLTDEAGEDAVEGTVNKVILTNLMECPFVYFRQYKWENMKEVLDAIRRYYPEIGVHDPITVVFYRVNIPIRGE